MRLRRSLIAALKDGNARARAQAARALGLLRPEKAVVPLIALLDDQDASVRAAAVNALPLINGSDQAVEPLIGLLYDADADVRRLAAGALTWINTDRAKQPFQAALQSENLKFIVEMNFFYISMGMTEAIPLLIEALNQLGDKEMAEDFLNCGNSELAECRDKLGLCAWLYHRTKLGVRKRAGVGQPVTAGQLFFTAIQYW